MKIIILLTILVSLTFFSCKDKITTPEEKAPIAKTDYFPLAVGNSWTYKYSALWGAGIFPEGYRDSSAGTSKWLITDYNSGIYTVKEVKTDTIKDTTYTNYFNIIQSDSIHIHLEFNATINWIDDILVRYQYDSELDTVNYYGRHGYQQINYLIQLKKNVGIVCYSSSRMDQGDWGSEKFELISVFINK